MPERHVTVEDHLSNQKNVVLINDYYKTLIHMVGEAHAKKIMMEATVYKKKTFECPRNHQLYTISFPE